MQRLHRPPGVQVSAGRLGQRFGAGGVDQVGSDGIRWHTV
ncbi:hypothetical protein PICSAR138_04496 [Mycobacterium avium subsp. paratuberculosis]|nr:hypothetical protein PICSAR138_04496 [Mycobacterium avium subsp. paratuberculosis]